MFNIDLLHVCKVLSVYLFITLVLHCRDLNNPELKAVFTNPLSEMPVCHGVKCRHRAVLAALGLSVI